MEKPEITIDWDTVDWEGVDEAALALMLLGIHDGWRAWKGFDWQVLNRLHEKGFISIGCEPCTRPVLPGQHEREGRWWWEEATKKECGLHT